MERLETCLILCNYVKMFLCIFIWGYRIIYVLILLLFITYIYSDVYILYRFLKKMYSRCHYTDIDVQYTDFKLSLGFCNHNKKKAFQGYI